MNIDVDVSNMFWPSELIGAVDVGDSSSSSLPVGSGVGDEVCTVDEALVGNGDEVCTVDKALVVVGSGVWTEAGHAPLPLIGSNS